MPYVAPTLKWRGGDGWDGNAGRREYAVPVTAGDLIIVTATTSDYLRNWTAIFGGSATWYNGPYLADLQGWGDAGIWYGRATQSGTFNVGMDFAGGNSGANYQVMRIFVWGGSDGLGGTGVERKYGNSDVNVPVNGRGGQTAVVTCAVDWNAAGVQGNTMQHGGPGYLDLYVAAGAARYWSGWNVPLSSPGAWWCGNAATGNSKVTTVGAEILGTWSDTTPPTVPGGVTAVMNKQGEATISWSASTDAEFGGSGVASYRVRRNGVDIVGATALGGLSYTDTAAKLSDWYTVSAVDNKGNRSGESAVASFATPPFRLGPDVPQILKAGSLNVDRLYLGPNRIWP